MRIGLIIAVRLVNEMSEKAVRNARTFSRPGTPVVVVFNGIDESPPCVPFQAPEGVTAVVVGEPLKSEMGYWRWAFAYAMEQKWDWAGVWHDDFMIEEPGWEDELERGAKFRIAIAGLDSRRRIDYPGGCPGTDAIQGEVAAFNDGDSIIFNMAVFGPLGAFTECGDTYGGGDLDAACWAAENSYGVWPILLKSVHHPDYVKNTRERSYFGYSTTAVCDKWRHVFPIVCTGARTVSTAGREYSIE